MFVLRALPPLIVAAACACSPATPPATTRLDRLPADARARVRDSSVPVLLPRDLDVAQAKLMVEPAFTALHVPGDGITISLHTARVTHPQPAGLAMDKLRPIRGGTGFVTVNEGVRTATWVEGGVSYALDLECAAAADPRCASDDYLLSLVAGLAQVGP
jgi:hypothetical protein